MALLKRKQKKRNSYVWRQDFSLLKEDRFHGKIGREVREHLVQYQVTLWIGAFAWGVLLLLFIVLLFCRANLTDIQYWTYIKLLGAVILILGLLCGRIGKVPKLTERDRKALEEEVKMASCEIKELGAFFTEDALIMQQGILVYRIPYLEIVKVREINGRYGTPVHYKLRDGTRIHMAYYGLLTYPAVRHPFVLLYEQLLKYNPDIVIKKERDWIDRLINKE